MKQAEKQGPGAGRDTRRICGPGPGIGRALLLLTLLAIAAQGSVVIDRIAVVVDKHAIKTSDIERDLRVTEFLNQQPPDFSPDAKRRAAERLIDQTIIRDEMEKAEYKQAGESDVDAMLKEIRQQRFGGSDARLNQDLARYGLGDDQLRMQLEWQLDVLKFIDQRFRQGTTVTDDEARDYYNQHRGELQRQYPLGNTFNEIAPKIRALLEGQRVNQSFEQWIAQARKRTRIEYRQGALQ